MRKGGHGAAFAKFPLLFKEIGCAINIMVPFRIGADGVVCKALRAESEVRGAANDRI